MKKAIKRITVYSLLIAVGLVAYFFKGNYVDGNNYIQKGIASNKSTESINGETQEANTPITGYYNNTTSADVNDYASMSTNGGNSYSGNVSSSNNNTPAIADLSANKENTNSSTIVTGGNEADNFKDVVASNYGSTNSYNSSNNVDNGYSNAMGGPNASSSSEGRFGEMNSSLSTTENMSSSLNTAASRASASTSTEPTAAGRVSQGSGGNSVSVPTISAPSAPVIETPGAPGGGTDPYVPIDDYYGLFALLLCGGVIFWYRNKQSKLVKVKA